MASRISATKWPTPERAPISGVTSRATSSGPGPESVIGAGAPKTVPEDPVSGHPLAPVLQRVAQGLVERNGRFPAGAVPELLRVADQELHVGGPHPLRHRPDLDVDLGHRQQDVEHPLDRQRLAPPDVVDLAGLALEGRLPVGLHGVPHVVEVAAGLQVAHLEDGGLPAGLDEGDLLGEVGRDEDVAPPGASWLKARVRTVRSPKLRCYRQPSLSWVTFDTA